MKNVLSLFAVIFALSLITSCGKGGGGENTPESVTKAFISALESGKYDKAKSLSTDETDASVDAIKTFADLAPEKKKSKIEKMTCEISGDDANCSYCCDTEGKDASIMAKKVGGKWLAHQPKEMPE